MSDFTNYGEILVADFLRGQGISLPANFEIGVLTAVSDSAYTEASWTGYDRVPVARSLAAWSGTQGAGTTLPSTGTSHQTSNNTVVDFGTVGSGASGTATHLGLFLGNSGGDLLAYAELETPTPLNPTDPLAFAAGSIVWTLGATGGLSDYLANKLIDLIWRAQSYTMAPTWYSALFTVAPTSSGGGTEVSAVGYSRSSIATTAGNWSRTAGVISNTPTITLPPVTSNWGTVVADAFYDAASGGNLLYWRNLVTPKTISAGAPSPRYAAGDRTIEVR